jgi:2-dehydropantoate 2-reductase
MDMRILVVGAGAIGGYFGGRLLAADRDVTFLVRTRRAAQLAKTGLIIRSPFGDANVPAPPTVMADAIRTQFDLILLSCKAYDLESAADSFVPAVGTNTTILPLLNGMAHVDFLTARFGVAAVLGGQCQISTTLDTEGHVLHLNDLHLLSFGELDGSKTPRAEKIAAILADAGFDSRLSTAILLEMWEKWLLIAAVAGITCLMRAPVGDIVAANATHLTTTLLDECTAVARAYGFLPRPAFIERIRTMITTPGSTFAASMLRDIEHNAPIEADHIVGDLIRRGEAKQCNIALLRIAYAHLKAYEARRAREADAAKIA